MCYQMCKFSGSVIVSDFGYSYRIYRACELVSVINRTESLSFGDLRDNTVCFRIDIFSFTFSIIKLQKKTLDVAFDILRVYKVYNCPPGSHYPHSYISFLPWHSLHLQVFVYHIIHHCTENKLHSEMEKSENGRRVGWGDEQEYPYFYESTWKQKVPDYFPHQKIPSVVFIINSGNQDCCKDSWDSLHDCAVHLAGLLFHLDI